MVDSINATRVGIARAIIRGGEDALDEAERRLRETARPLTLRDQIMIPNDGLCEKHHVLPQREVLDVLQIEA